MNYQNLLLASIRKIVGSTISINDEIASVLNISYDAAHRRVSGKTKFSVDEAAHLAHHYKISLDTIFEKSSHIIIEKTIEIQSMQDMFQYFSQSANTIQKLTASPNSILYYSAKDIPLFYFMDGTILSKFKAFVWHQMLNDKNDQTTFEDFVITVSFFEPMQKLKKAYEKNTVREVWNDTTINSSLQQITYFYEAGLLTAPTTSLLFNDLRRILKIIKRKCNDTNSRFSIYFNELILLNNNLLFANDYKLTMFVPYTLLGYFMTENIESCKNVQQFFEQQIKNSIHLNNSGIREQNNFFDKMNRKIDFFETQIKMKMQDF